MSDELLDLMLALAPHDATDDERGAVLQRLRDDVAYRCLFEWMVNRIKRLEDQHA